MDGIVNSIMNGCSPRVPIDVGIENIDGKSVIAVRMNVYRNNALDSEVVKFGKSAEKHAGDGVNEGVSEGASNVYEEIRRNQHEMHCRALRRRPERAEDDRVGAADRVPGRGARAMLNAEC